MGHGPKQRKFWAILSFGMLCLRVAYLCGTLIGCIITCIKFAPVIQVIWPADNFYRLLRLATKKVESVPEQIAGTRRGKSLPLSLWAR